MGLGLKKRKEKKRKIMYGEFCLVQEHEKYYFFVGLAE